MIWRTYNVTYALHANDHEKHEPIVIQWWEGNCPAVEDEIRRLFGERAMVRSVTLRHEEQQ